MTTKQVSSLRETLAAHTPRKGKRYDKALKSDVIAFAHAARADGRSWATIASELGLRFETLRRWCMDRPPSSSSPRALRRVEIIAESSPRSLTVISPNGFRVECTTLADAAALLRALG